MLHMQNRLFDYAVLVRLIFIFKWLETNFSRSLFSCFIKYRLQYTRFTLYYTINRDSIPAVKRLWFMDTVLCFAQRNEQTIKTAHMQNNVGGDSLEFMCEFPLPPSSWDFALVFTSRRYSKTLNWFNQPANLFNDNSTGTLLASLSGTFLQTLPDLVTPLKGHPLSPRSCPPTWSAPSKRFGYW